MQIIVAAHNIRSTHNVGSILRTCDGFGVGELIFSGYTPYPTLPDDPRLPHITAKLTTQIHKTALGAENTVPFRYTDDLPADISRLKESGFRIVALEQAARSIRLQEYAPAEKTCLILGEEIAGVRQSILDLCDDIVEIGMAGRKESFNVSVATGIALYALTSG